MKQIKLTKGLYALVDEDKFDLLNQHSWHASYQKKDDCYLAKTIIDNKSISMHRFLLNITSAKLRVLHINNNKLDNRKENLKVLSGNSFNSTKKMQRYNKTGYKGVTEITRKEMTKYKSQIMVNGKHINLGYYDTKEEAAREYNKAARKYFGELAYQN